MPASVIADAEGDGGIVTEDDHGHDNDGDRNGRLDEHTIYNLNTALAVVREKLSRLDVEEQCRRAGANYESGEGGPSAGVDYLGERYRVTFADGEVSPVGNSEELSLRERVLVLHYLAKAKGGPPTGRQITYRDLPGGIVYYPTFAKRTVDQMARYFGDCPERLAPAAAAIEGKVADIGDSGVVIAAFNRVPITLALWHGDDEFAASANLLFDGNISDYLEPEDVTIVCEVITWRLVRQAAKQEASD